MLAAVLKDFNQLVLEQVPDPKPGPGEVVVRIKACGFCATDFKAIKGIRRNVKFPFIPGHEPSGIVAAVGYMAVRAVLDRRRMRVGLGQTDVRVASEADGKAALSQERR